MWALWGAWGWFMHRIQAFWVCWGRKQSGRVWQATCVLWGCWQVCQNLDPVMGWAEKEKRQWGKCRRRSMQGFKTHQTRFNSWSANFKREACSGTLTAASSISAYLDMPLLVLVCLPPGKHQTKQLASQKHVKYFKMSSPVIVISRSLDFLLNCLYVSPFFVKIIYNYVRS